MKSSVLPGCLAALFILFALPAAARAIEIKISAQALERTLNKQLFNGDQGRYYIRGKEEKGCFAYAQDPKVTFKEDRIVVHVKTRAKLGASLRGECVGVAVSTDADVSVVPDAQGETIGFRDPRIENLSDFKELNFFLIPFLSKKLPQQMKVNAADFVRQILSTSMQTTGYEMKLDHLKIHSMQIDGNSLVVDFDGDLSVN
jgi:hypothetical protein